ncbi:MAG: single-stranded-DNA-specific exonuclease RecJ [Clostridiales bacterium]|nr:single-stranded-DNA-specific exonuclease RecJ [Clostridiales bacterium]
MKRILPEFEFSEQQLNIVRTLARESGLCEDTVKILYGRGVRDRESIYSFMHPSKSHFISPFKMSGMREAVDLITRARDEEWDVLVYGDYDADGICASTIMGGVLRDFGLNPFVLVPERTNGYGLSIELLDGLFEEFFPQLVITVDCGISCCKEVEYLKEMGAEVIVTDHHELPDNIPDCICINPKFNDGYIYDNLCGAGVAFKVGCALLGEKAYKYLDFAAIATVADSVPLTGENRDIVFEGLKLINNNPSKCYKQFINKAESVTSQTLAFSIAPKINAAGRMGDATAALNLFSETDERKIDDLAAKLTSYNLERQKYCEELYLSAKQKISEQGAAGNVIMLCDENWNTGFVGIVAARLADEYSRPAILFVKNGSVLKGSARSVENVNIFEALKACDSYITEFGGHSQAAGVNITEDNFVALHTALEEFISAHYSGEDFVPTVYVNGKLESELSPKLVREIEMLEPYGVGNKRPLFTLTENSVPARVTKAGSPHIAVKSNKLDLMYFGGSKFIRLIESDAPKEFIFEYNVSQFRGKEYIKGFIKEIICPANSGAYAEEAIALTYIENLASVSVAYNKKSVSESEISDSLKQKDEGVAYLCWNYKTAERFAKISNTEINLFTPSAKNFSSVILLAPETGVDLSGYKRVILLDDGVYNIPSILEKCADVYENGQKVDCLDKISCDRDELLKIYALISANERAFDGFTPYDVVKENLSDIDKPQLLFALCVFEELGLITFVDGRLKVNRSQKTKLENSNLYNSVALRISVSE